MTCFLPFSSVAQKISLESKVLGYCEFVYFYVAQLQQLRNNEGAAKAYLNRSAMMSTAFFISEEVDGTVSGEKIKASRTLGLNKKQDFDKQPESVVPEVAKCDKEAIGIATHVRSTGKRLWGKSFDELQAEMFSKSRGYLGVN